MAFMPLTTTDHTGARALKNCEPWLVHHAVNWLEGFLLERKVLLRAEQTVRILEWGCGGSTIWYARRADRVTSIEHSLKWHYAISEKAARLQVYNIDHVHIPCRGPQGCFRPYAEFVKDFHGSTFDLINIDGRARVRCIEQVMEHHLVKPSGALVLDNSERAYYSPGVKMLTDAGWYVKHFADQWRTTIFQRPGPLAPPRSVIAEMAASQAGRQVAGS